jgi:hypothetical protein
MCYSSQAAKLDAVEVALVQKIAGRAELALLDLNMLFVIYENTSGQEVCRRAIQDIRVQIEILERVQGEER